jgi:type I restriction enzyme S subunit
MYLACSLEDIGHSITCCKPGPDILLTTGETRIWVEAVTASGGEAGRPDSIPERRLGEVNDSPEKEILLRIRAAIREKFEYKYQKYVMDGIIDQKDAYVVAVNASKIFYHAIVEMHMPRIVQAVYPVGCLQIKYDRETMKEVDRSYAFRPELQKVTGESVSTNIFFEEPYRALSGVLYSCVDATYVPERMGDDFVFVHNLNATVGVPHGLLGRGREYSVVQTEDGFSLNNRNWRDE